MNKKLSVSGAVALAIVIISASLITYATAAYLMQSNRLSHTSSNQAVITLSQNSTTSVVGLDTVQLTATEPGITTGTLVTFYDGDTVLGTATASGNTAIYNLAVASAKTWDFHATAIHP